MEYLGFDVGYGWWKPAASKMQPLQDMQNRDNPKKGLHDVRSFVGACNLYRRHIHNFTYSSAPLSDLIKKTTLWRWTAREEECFQELKKKIAPSNCLGVPRPKGEIVLITDASDLGGGGTIYQWQELNPAELTHCHFCLEHARKKKPRKRRTARKNKAKNCLFRPQKPPQKLYAAVWRRRKI